MKNVVVAVGLLALTGCSHTARAPVVVQQNTIVEIPPDFLECSGVTYPEPDGLTDKQVARLLVRLDAALKTCKGNLDAIRDLQDAALKRLRGGEIAPPSSGK